MQKNIDYLFSRGPMIVFENLNKIQNKVVKILDDTLNIDLSGFCSEMDSVPSADCCEKKGAYVIDIDLPGVDIKDVEITFKSDKLIVSGHREGAPEPKKKEAEGAEEEEIVEEKYLCQEISYGSFKRVFDMPSEVDEDKIKASLKNGVLSITIPKTKESETKLKKIKIES